MKGVEYQGSSRKRSKGTCGKTLASLVVNGVQCDYSSSFLVISSILIKPRGNSMVIISFLWGEGGAGVGAITSKGDRSWEISDSGSSTFGSVNSMSKTSLVLDSLWPILVSFGLEWTKHDSNSCVGFTSVSIVSYSKNVDISSYFEVPNLFYFDLSVLIISN